MNVSSAAAAPSAPSATTPIALVPSLPSAPLAPQPERPVAAASVAVSPAVAPTEAPNMATFGAPSSRRISSEDARARSVVRALPVQPGDWVLDFRCGAGAFLPWLAERIGPYGHLTALEGASVDMARRQASRAPASSSIEVRRFAGDRLPFPAATFDVVIAHGLLALDAPACVLAELARVVKRGGHIAVLELGSAGGGEGLALEALFAAAGLETRGALLFPHVPHAGAGAVVAPGADLLVVGTTPSA